MERARGQGRAVVASSAPARPGGGGGCRVGCSAPFHRAALDASWGVSLVGFRVYTRAGEGVVFRMMSGSVALSG